MRTNLRFPLRYIMPRNQKWERVTDLTWLTSACSHRYVRVADLVGIQSFVTIAGIKTIKTTDDRRPIYVVKIASVYYIRDGHHRVTNALLSGKKKIFAAVLELEDENV